jgi:hypothetical protein
MVTVRFEPLTEEELALRWKIMRDRAAAYTANEDQSAKVTPEKRPRILPDLKQSN